MGISKFFTKGAVGASEYAVNQDKLIASMLRVLMENGDSALYELLCLLQPYYEKSVLSIIKIEDRSVVISTDERGVLEDIARVAYSISNPEKEGYYLRGQKNNVWFRQEFDCLKVMPLQYAGSVKYVLLIECAENSAVSVGRAVGVLALAVYLYMSERELSESYYIDTVTKLPNRDAFIRNLQKEEDIRFLGMFLMKNQDSVLVKSGYGAYDLLVKQAVTVWEKIFPNAVYRMGECRFAVLVKEEDMFSCVSRMQNALDELVRVSPGAVFSASVVSASISKDWCRVLYACEKACDSASKDTVMVIRSMDAISSSEEVNEMYVSGAYAEEKVMDVKAEEVFFSGERMSKDEAVATAQEDLDFIYGIPDMDE